MIQSLDEFKTYKKAIEVAERIYNIVYKWNYFDKDTVGKQLIRAVDSIAANLSEGLGRFHYKEIKNFAYYSRGSLFETRTWLTKASIRKLIEEKTFIELTNELDVIGKMINTYINSIGDKNNGVNEPEEEYQALSPNSQFLESNSPIPKSQVPMPNTQVPMPKSF